MKEYVTKVLVVDDDPAICQAVKQRLERAGHSVHTVNNGEDALLCISTFGPQVLILDISMPGIDGYEVCRRIREGVEKPMTIVYLTGTTHAGTGCSLQQLVRQSGGDYYIMKPYDPKLLVDLVDQIAFEEGQLERTGVRS